MKIITVITAVALIGAHAATAGNVIMTTDVQKTIGLSAAGKKAIVPVDKHGLYNTKYRFRQRVGNSFDIEKSTKRESRRFNRTTFKIMSDKDHQRFLTETMDP